MKRSITCLFAVGALSAGLLAPAGTATAVPRSDFPSVKQVAEVFPALRGASRVQVRELDLFVGHYPGKCSSPHQVTGRSGALTTYRDEAAPQRFAQIYVTNFASRKKAQRVVTLMRDYARACRAYETSQTSTTVARISTPKLGDDRVAVRFRSVSPTSSIRSAGFFVRDGRRVISVVVRNPTAVKAKKLIRLTRIAYQRAS